MREAADAFRQAVRYEPTNADYLLELGTAYINLGDKVAAIQQYQILKTLNTGLAQRLYRLIYW